MTDKSMTDEEIARLWNERGDDLLTHMDRVRLMTGDSGRVLAKLFALVPELLARAREAEAAVVLARGDAKEAQVAAGQLRRGQAGLVDASHAFVVSLDELLKYYEHDGGVPRAELAESVRRYRHGVAMSHQRHPGLEKCLPWCFACSLAAAQAAAHRGYDRDEQAERIRLLEQEVAALESFRERDADLRERLVDLICIGDGSNHDIAAGVAALKGEREATSHKWEALVAEWMERERRAREERDLLKGQASLRQEVEDALVGKAARLDEWERTGSSCPLCGGPLGTASRLLEDGGNGTIAVCGACHWRGTAEKAEAAILVERGRTDSLRAALEQAEAALLAERGRTRELVKLATREHDGHCEQSPRWTSLSGRKAGACLCGADEHNAKVRAALESK